MNKNVSKKNNSKSYDHSGSQDIFGKKTSINTITEIHKNK